MLEVKKLKVATIGHVPLWGDGSDWLELVKESSGLKCEVQRLDRIQNGLANLGEFDLIRLDAHFSEEIAPSFPAAPPLVSQLKYLDLIVKKKGVLWPYIIHKEALHSLILDRHPHLNLKGAALIVGQTPQAILASRAFIELGVKHITFVVEDPESAEAFLAQASKSLFEVHFELIQKDQVVLLPGIYSAVACYKNLAAEPELMEGLLYFSYLIHGGLIIMYTAMEREALIEEAAAINANVFNLGQVQLYEEIMALSKVSNVTHQQIKFLESRIIKDLGPRPVP